VTRLDPGNYIDWITLARLYADVDRPAKAMSAAERARETAQNPAQRARALRQIAGFLSGRGDNQNALTLLDQALEIAAQADAPTGRDSALAVMAEVLLTRVDVLRRLEESALEPNKEAVAALRKAVEQSPDDVAMQFNLANALRQLGSQQPIQDDMEGGNAFLAEALSIIEALIAKDPSDLSYKRFRGSLLFQFAWRATNLEAKVAFADRLIAEMTPVAAADGQHSYTLLSLLRAYSLKGDALFEQDKLDEANASYKAAKDIGATLYAADPNQLTNYSWVRSNLSTYAYSLYHSGQFEEALKVSDEFKEIVRPKIDGSELSLNTLSNEYFHGYASYWRALSLIKLNRLEEATAELLSVHAANEKVIGLKPKRSDSWDLQTDLLIELAGLKAPGFTWKRAIDFMEELNRSKPGFVDVAERLEEARANAKRDGEILP
jgi:tetratricopeptide (TPR) repeat protein